MARTGPKASAVVESSRFDEPVRTCIGCRGKGGRSVLLRVTLRDEDAVFDTRRAMPGRGAWLHPDTDCLHKAIVRKAIPRALRAQHGVDTDGLEQQLTEILSATSHM